MDEGESFSPWQPITNDPTPRKGWRDERTDGDNGGGVGRREERRKEQGTKRNTKQEKRTFFWVMQSLNKQQEQNRQQWCLIYKWRTVKEKQRKDGGMNKHW